MTSTKVKPISNFPRKAAVAAAPEVRPRARPGGPATIGCSAGPPHAPTPTSRMTASTDLRAPPEAILFDAYTILNTATEVEEFSVTGPDSRLTSAVQPPRAVHLGLRLTF